MPQRIEDRLTVFLYLLMRADKILNRREKITYSRSEIENQHGAAS